MVDLARLTPKQSYARSAGSGYGLRMLCRSLGKHANGPSDADMWLWGVRNAQAPTIMRTPVTTSHMQSADRAIEHVPGLVDGGEIAIQGNWKPASAASSGNTWDPMAWLDDVDSIPSAKNINDGFLQSLLYDDDFYEIWLIPAAWTRAVIVARGFVTMFGGQQFDPESSVPVQGSFKVSGRPMYLYPSAVTTVSAVAGTAIPGGSSAGNRFRLTRDDGDAEYWSKLHVTSAPTWEETPAGGAGKLLTYKERPGWDVS